jgi:hypothetical protein
MPINVSEIVLNSLQNPSTVLADKEKVFLKYLLNDSPESLQKIDAAIDEIMSDGKIDFHDIPQIIFVISNIVKNSKIKTSADMVSIVQFIIDSILDSGLLPIPNFEVEILKKVVDSSMGLLKTNIGSIKTTVCCCF